MKARWLWVGIVVMAPSCLAFDPLDAVNRERGEERFPDECQDGFDNDFDGLIDCDDPSCCGVQACRDRNPACTNAGEEAGLLCANGVDDDGDGYTDCDDDSCCGFAGCVLAPRCAGVIPVGSEDCYDGIDNDGNGAIDCLDWACCREEYCQYTSPVCGAVVPETGELCWDGIDNNGDLATDCEEWSCCLEEHCFNHPNCGAIAIGCPALPPATNALIDDFLDQNPTLPPIDGRTGAWVAANDESGYGHQVPASGEAVFPELGHDSSGGEWHVHTQGEGFPVFAGLSVPFAESGYAFFCYQDVSKFRGIGFRARGRGGVRLGMVTASIVPIDLGGTCPSEDRNCLNTFGKTVSLQGDWSDHLVDFADMRQRDWGGGGVLPILGPDVTAVAGLEFNAEDPSDFDFSIARVWFLE